MTASLRHAVEAQRNRHARLAQARFRDAWCFGAYRLPSSHGATMPGDPQRPVR